MTSIKKKYFVAIALLLLLGFIFPFFISEDSDTQITILSLSFTIVGTLLAIVALVVAIVFLDRFGIDAKFKEKQVDAVIELAVLIKSANIIVTSGKLNYFIHKTQSSEQIRKEFYRYKDNSNKTVLFPGNYDEIAREFFKLKSSYWLPEQIKERFGFLDIRGLEDVEDPIADEYVRLNINDQANGVWMKSIPAFNFEELNESLHDLLAAIKSWLDEHSKISPDFHFFK